MIWSVRLWKMMSSFFSLVPLFSKNSSLKGHCSHAVYRVFPLPQCLKYIELSTFPYSLFSFTPNSLTSHVCRYTSIWPTCYSVNFASSFSLLVDFIDRFKDFNDSLSMFANHLGHKTSDKLNDYIVRMAVSFKYFPFWWPLQTGENEFDWPYLVHVLRPSWT